MCHVALAAGPSAIVIVTLWQILVKCMHAQGIEAQPRTFHTRFGPSAHARVSMQVCSTSVSKTVTFRPSPAVSSAKPSAARRSAGNSADKKPFALTKFVPKQSTAVGHKLVTMARIASPEERAQGKLAPPPSSPNCVSSQASPSDSQHYMDPLTYSGSVDEARKTLEMVINGLPRTQIVVSEGNYLHAVFTTRLMRYKDDVEFIFGPNGRLDFSSRSRVGYGDMGANRSRMNEIKSKWQSGTRELQKQS
eukprot:jgi/Mesvir1/11997/Mv00303-RA.1